MPPLGAKFHRTEGFTAETAEDAEVKLIEVTERVIGAAISVHRFLGPGLLESTYEACLAHEVSARGLRVERQKALPILYKGVQIECGYRLDLLVEGQVIVELKAVTHLEPIHEAQLLSYLRLSGCHVGLLINFHVWRLSHGLRRLVWRLPEVSSANSAFSAVQSPVPGAWSPT